MDNDNCRVPVDKLELSSCRTTAVEYEFVYFFLRDLIRPGWGGGDKGHYKLARA